MTHLSERDYAILKAKIAAQFCQGIVIADWNEAFPPKMVERSAAIADMLLQQCGIEEVKDPHHL